MGTTYITPPLRDLYITPEEAFAWQEWSRATQKPIAQEVTDRIISSNQVVRRLSAPPEKVWHPEIHPKVISDPSGELKAYRDSVAQINADKGKARVNSTGC